jgi:hypothetical protein
MGFSFLGLDWDLFSFLLGRVEGLDFSLGGIWGTKVWDLLGFG